MSIKAIDTQYKGYRFRSRLEARYAVMFDALGLEWEYEPEGFDLGNGVYYLPDFKVKYPEYYGAPAFYEWFEVKGDTSNISIEECVKIFEFSKHHSLTILDGSPKVTVYQRYDSDDHGVGGLSPVLIMADLQVLPALKLEQRTGHVLLVSGRMWFDHHPDFFNGGTCVEYLETAVNKARSARFEHGEKP